MRLREINSPGELAVDPDLIDRFTQAGWQIDGEGQDQLVMSKPGSNTVLKVVGSGSQPRQAEIRRYVNFFRANQRDPHFPRVGADRELSWKGQKYYAYTQERLQNLPGDEAVMDYLEYAMGELGHGEEPDLARVPKGLTVEDIEGLTAAVDHMFESGLGGQYGFDLANLANIMQRSNGQLVIVDPFSGFDDELSENKLAEASSGYREIEFVCVNPEFPDATDPNQQRRLARALKQIPGVITLVQDWSDHSPGQCSLTAIYRGAPTGRRIRKVAEHMGVAIDLEQPVSDAYVDRAIRGEHEGQQAVAEARQPVLNILRQALPDWPDYVLKDWLGTRVKDQDDLKNLRGWIDEIKKTVQPNSWQLHQKMPITFDMLDPKTRYFMKTKRQFGDRNPFMIPRDRERLEDAMRLVQEKGIENLPPVIMLQGPKGLELTEGWHRTMAAFRQHPDGFRINAWIGQRSQQVNEVQILAKVKGKGSEPGQIPKYGRPISADQEIRYLGQQVGKVGRYQLWRDWLGGQLSYHVFDPESRTVVLTTFGSRYHRNPNSYIIHGLYAAPGNPVKAHQFYRHLIQDQGLTLISDRKQSPGGNRVWQRLEAYPDIEVYGFDTKTGEVMNFGAADSEMYAVPPRAAKDRESKYIAKNIRLVATAR